jgi:hypothetical protein
MNLGSPEHLNIRLSQVRFLNCDADRVSYERMVAVIRGLQRPGDEFKIPDAAEPDAWRRAYSIYERLQQRESSAPTQAEQQVEARLDQQLQSYSINLADMNARVKSGEISGTALDYLGIKGGDLGNPIAAFDPNSRDPHRRRSDWLDVAGRLSAALVEWQSLSPADKALIPQRLTIRRLERAVRDLTLRVSKLEQLSQERQVA